MAPRESSVVRISPMSTSTLPKDVGLCAKCNTTNSKHATRCRQCSDILPWAQPKTATSGASAKAGAPSDKPFKPKSPLVETLGNLHWGGTIAFLFLVIGVFLLSIVWPFWGFKMYRYFSDEHNNLSYAAAAGLAVLFIGVMAIMIMAGGGKTAT